MAVRTNPDSEGEPSPRIVKEERLSRPVSWERDRMSAGGGTEVEGVTEGTAHG